MNAPPFALGTIYESPSAKSGHQQFGGNFRFYLALCAFVPDRDYTMQPHTLQSEGKRFAIAGKTVSSTWPKQSLRRMKSNAPAGASSRTAPPRCSSKFSALPARSRAKSSTVCDASSVRRWLQCPHFVPSAQTTDLLSCLSKWHNHQLLGQAR